MSPGGSVYDGLQVFESRLIFQNMSGSFHTLVDAMCFNSYVLTTMEVFRVYFLNRYLDIIEISEV